MKKTGINLENVKQRNKASILRLLNKNGPMSRKDIAAEVGLTPASVTLLTNEMIETGYLREVGEVQEEKRAGRRKILVSIVYDW
ncbi:MAG: winged helix-turn-helix transcriptional regulator, partial [Ruminococcaceae bacterium]|nr:winged helix-turn-helix transcriptional regulator [Oscillospiraceae bacterium]